MDEFLDISFGTATNYASRIFLTEDATEADADRLLNEYNADRSASVSIQSGDKAVSLDIYDITHDTVRFIDRQSNTVALQNDGAYICSRIAEDRNLKVGDTFTVNPYGSDDTYTLRVAGILHSMSGKRRCDRFLCRYTENSLHIFFSVYCGGKAGYCGGRRD